MDGLEIFTIGHSNQPLESFVDLLRRHGIGVLVDIRRFPASRAFPHFNQDVLAAALRTAGIEYEWVSTLGGRRSRRKDVESPNAGLHNASFRNFADYMLTAGFRDGMERLAAIARDKRTAIMCSEAVFWRCHRRLISDYVIAGGGTVWHIFPNGEVRPHRLTEGANVVNGTVTWPAGKSLFD